MRCPACCNDGLEFVFERNGRRFGLCPSCHAYLRLDAKSLIDDPYADGDFAARVKEVGGGSPDFQAFQVFSNHLVPGNLLEIGPGTGAFLAAARAHGYQVTGIEPSPSQRKLIREKWGIETFAEALEVSPPGEALFDNVVSINCIEHIPKTEEHFRAVHKVLKPGGRFLISTCNPESLVARLAGRWWTMFKPPDHFNIVSLKSMKAIGGRIGFTTLKEWSSEYPLETAISLLASMRDWLRSRKYPSSSGDSTGQNGRSRLQRMAVSLERNRFFSPLGMTISWLGLGNSIKIVFEKPGSRTD